MIKEDLLRSQYSTYWHIYWQTIYCCVPPLSSTGISEIHLFLISESHISTLLVFIDIRYWFKNHRNKRRLKHSIRIFLTNCINSILVGKILWTAKMQNSYLVMLVELKIHCIPKHQAHSQHLCDHFPHPFRMMLQCFHLKYLGKILSK